MRADALRALLEQVAGGSVAPGTALEVLARLPIEPVTNGDGTVPFARIDHHRALRVGFPEVVFCPGKSVAQVVEICRRLEAAGSGFLVTRTDEGTREAIVAAFPRARAHALARVVHLSGPAHEEQPADEAPVLVVTGGTSDLPVAEEAAVTAEVLGSPVERLYDVGVAGIHRLLAENDVLRRAGVIIAVAGMEGALPSVIGGLVSVPVIAVPTSVGYGASFGGVAALLAMLNSCVAGVTVVNIDNGFGAACAATRIRLARVAR